MNLAKTEDTAANPEGNLAKTEDTAANPEGNLAKTEDTAANPEGKNSAEPAVAKETEPKASAAASTLMRFRLAAGGDPEKALRKYVASFTGDETKMLGQAPPCRSYQALVLFQTFEGKTEAFEKCVSKDEITRIQNDMKPFKAAYQDMLSMAKAAEKRLGTSITDALRQKEQAKTDASEPKAKRGRPSKKQAGQTAAAAGPMVDQPQECARDIPSIVMRLDGKLSEDLAGDAPKIIRVCQEEMSKLAEIKSSCLGPLETKFKHDPARADTGRSQRALPADQRDKIMKLLQACFVDGFQLPLDKMTEKVKQDLSAATGFIVSKGWVTTSAEAAHLPTCRLGFAGSRSVVIAHTLSLLEFITKASGAKSDLAKCYAWLKSCTPQAAKSFVESFDAPVLMHATAGPSDILFLPAGWMFYEKIVGNANFLGVRAQHLGLSCLADLRKINTYLIELGKPNSSLQQAVDCLSLAEA